MSVARLGLILVLGACAPGISDIDVSVEDSDQPDPVDDPRFDALAAAVESELDQLGAPGLAIAYFEAGEVVWSRGFGQRHPNQDEPVADTTLFRIGSITKMMTATALLQQVSDLDQPITAVVPDLELAQGNADEIRLEHLVTHQAAFVDYAEVDCTAELDAHLVGWAAQNLYQMAPSGSFWNYSNPNFMYAGLVVERASGTGFRPYMANHVFEPLGMTRTVFDGQAVVDDGDYATGATVDWVTGFGSALAGPESYDCAWSAPAGFAWSSVHDLARFGQFLVDGDAEVLTDSRALTENTVDTQQVLDLALYGYGVNVSRGFFVGQDWYDTPLWSHAGGIPGFSADLYVLPEQNAGVAILANADGAYLGRSVAEALKLAGLPAPGTAPDLSIDADGFTDFAGDYDDPWNAGLMKVEASNGGLTVELPLLDDFAVPYEAELDPVLPDNFLFTVQGYPLLMTFIRGPSGEIEFARTRSFVHHRLEEHESSARADRPRIRLHELREASALDRRQLNLLTASSH